MRSLFSPAARARLRRFMASGTLLAFDYDGTLAPLGPDPERAAMRRSTRRLLREAARRFPCVVITGRKRASVEKFLRGLGILAIVGNHGADGAPPADRAAFRRVAARWERELRAALRGVAGVRLENKGTSLSVHYRSSRRKAEALRRIARAAERLERCRVVAGIDVVNLIPLGAPNKASVLRSLRTDLGCRRALFIGDDVTDEEVFGSEPPSRLLSVRVGRAPRSRAEWTIGRQADVDRFLRLLVQAVRAPV